MKLTSADRRVAAVIVVAAAIMILSFAQRNAGSSTLVPRAWDPPGVTARADRDGLVDVNTAGLDELMTLPGIGEVRARAILDDREANGPFRYPEDLIRVEGIGEGILSGILDQITTGR